MDEDHVLFQETYALSGWEAQDREDLAAGRLRVTGCGTCPFFLARDEDDEERHETPWRCTHPATDIPPEPLVVDIGLPWETPEECPLKVAPITVFFDGNGPQDGITPMTKTTDQTNETETLRRELEEARREKTDALRERDDALSEMRKAYQDVKDIEAEYDLNLKMFRRARSALEQIVAMDTVSFSLGDAKEIAQSALKIPEVST